MKLGNIRPRKWWYVISVLIFIIGISAFVLWLVKGISGITNGSQQFVVPGKSEIFLSEPGKYEIFYEYRSVVNGKVYLTEENLSGLQCTLKDRATDQFVPMGNPSINSNYSLGGRAGISVLEFTVKKAGIYDLSAQYSSGKEGQEVVLAIGKGIGGKISGVIIVGIAIFLLTIALSIIVFVVTFLMRRRVIPRR